VERLERKKKRGHQPFILHSILLQKGRGKKKKPPVSSSLLQKEGGKKIGNPSPPELSLFCRRKKERQGWAYCRRKEGRGKKRVCPNLRPSKRLRKRKRKKTQASVSLSHLQEKGNKTLDGEGCRLAVPPRGGEKKKKKTDLRLPRRSGTRPAGERRKEGKVTIDHGVGTRGKQRKKEEQPPSNHHATWPSASQKEGKKSQAGHLTTQVIAARGGGEEGKKEGKKREIYGAFFNFAFSRGEGGGEREKGRNFLPNRPLPSDLPMEERKGKGKKRRQSHGSASPLLCLPSGAEKGGGREEGGGRLGSTPLASSFYKEKREGEGEGRKKSTQGPFPLPSTGGGGEGTIDYPHRTSAFRKKGKEGEKKEAWRPLLLRSLEGGGEAKTSLS